MKTITRKWKKMNHNEIEDEKVLDRILFQIELYELSDLYIHIYIQAYLKLKRLFIAFYDPVRRHILRSISLEL